MKKIKYIVYKITFPNNKIYIGKDIGGTGHSFIYFGSWNSELVLNDFGDTELRNFTITKEILFESDDKNLVSKKEFEYIKKYNSNNPAIGYNQTPKYSNKKS